MSIGRHRHGGCAGEPGNEATPIGKPDVDRTALTGHGHHLPRQILQIKENFRRLVLVLRTNDSGIITNQIAEPNVEFRLRVLVVSKLTKIPGCNESQRLVGEGQPRNAPRRGPTPIMCMTRVIL